ncbi:MAG: glycosyltransferase family 2 protein [Alloprevotella sp.]|nr:glycosyltransferase family 2 protein [Alloprevotella sp.]
MNTLKTSHQRRVTVLVPCYNEAEVLPVLYDALCRVATEEAAYAWDFLFVNDGSRDDTLVVLRRLRQEDARVSYVDLSRNFGKERAMLAGFDYAGGDAVIVMDADMQHPPSLIPQMLRAWEVGYEDVYARRTNRDGDGWLRRRLTHGYYKLLARATRGEVLENVGDFRLLDRRCIEALRQMRETERYTKGMFSWIGFRKKEIPFEVQQRAAGKSSWSYAELMRLAIEGITSYTTAPLRLATWTGLLCALGAFLYMCFFFVKTLVVGDDVQGFPTLIIVILFLGGVQLVSLGIIGEYLGRIFHETKRRPPYLVREVEGAREENTVAN